MSKFMDPVIKVKKTHPDAVLPAANNKELGTGDTGYDLVAIENVKIAPGGSNIVSVGLQLAYITPGFWFKIEPRSGLGFKHSIQPHLGVIDNGYRGDLGVKLYNFDSSRPFHVKAGDKIAQLVVYPLIQPVFEFRDEITETSRGDRGFGSSDHPKSNKPTGDLTRPPFAGMDTLKASAIREDSSSFYRDTSSSQSACDNTTTYTPEN